MPMGIGPGLSVTRFECGIPGWMAGMDLGWDWVSNSKYNGAVDPTDTHSAAINAQFAAGGWSPFAANTLVRTDLGLQTVPTRTNLLLQSQAINNASWSATAGSPTITADNTTAPDGMLTADKWARITTAASYTGQNVAKAASAIQYVLSTFVKSETGRYAAIRMQGVYPNRVDAVFDLQTGSVSSAVASGTFSGATANISPAANGFYRVSISSTTDTATVVGSYVSFNSNAGQIDALDSSSSSSGWVWQMQLEAASFASPPIVTTSSSATVDGNQQVVDLTGRLSAGVGGIIQFNGLSALVAGDFGRIITFTDGGADDNNAFRIYRDGATRYLSELWTGAVKQAGIPITGGAISGLQTLAFAYAENYVNARFVGQSASSADTSASLPTLTKMNIGSNGINGASGNYQLTRRLALRFGAQDATTFADLFAKATILAAVS